MMFQIRHAAAAVFLVVAGTGAAQAQTVIATQPPGVVVTRPPLQLTPTQRTTIYRTIVPRSHGRKPIVHERVVTESVAPPQARERVVVPAPVAPTVGERVVVPGPAYVESPQGYVADDYGYVAPPAYGPPPRVAAPVSATYAVGTRVPASARLVPLPQQVVVENPNLQPYRYMVFRDRVLLVDPQTSTIVADVTQ